MASHVALLRGINVGKAKRVAMADLRALIEGLGYAKARTLLNSGNAVFDAPGVAAGEAAARIEHGLVERLGVSSRVVVVTTEELGEIVAENPLLERATDHARFMVGFVVEPGDLRRLDAQAGEDWAPAALAVGSLAAYLWLPGGLIDSPLAQAVGRALKDRVTLRNWTTTTKLLALARGG